MDRQKKRIGAEPKEVFVFCRTKMPPSACVRSTRQMGASCLAFAVCDPFDDFAEQAMGALRTWLEGLRPTFSEDSTLTLRELSELFAKKLGELLIGYFDANRKRMAYDLCKDQTLGGRRKPQSFPRWILSYFYLN